MTSAKENILRHLAIIMDGNGRWAKSKLKPRIFGHRNSISSVDASIEYCVEKNIEMLTLFAFGRDNWLRPAQEVADLMDLFYKTLKDKTPKLHDNNIVLNVVGDRTRLSGKLINIIEYSESLTKANTGLKLRLAVDYAGRWDIVEAAKAIARDVSAGRLSLDGVDQQGFSKYLIGGDVPIDLLIRTSGEVRLSDFMLWQLAYAEMYFTDTMWPDFSKQELNKAVEYFYSRQRRFGKSGEQI
ncbi:MULTISPECIES: polyprenyl diphosphate synthase [Francisella]|uniref:Ditrans,polycis-undecaprenyl-diphosphate synthase ((2E,6E)-farnesyl-diphosphate specific) n=1 Tax=Francisella opportunistica TaxID=2016517 RepID=A0A345JPM7_9GAMM|nr:MULTISPECIES: polyprenyl diphosphate synthase [Francisella]APC90949.1 Undecaprenyl pyrophosphate synthetase [Francisella sp. MA067296]AXH29273.1 di-trans,poly-cis-decaprenylcistransferase [Francisella opportunistica]AXH30924.1 di-trans,poly-cis-decaprenylcistransferase [Francisella opportunistica]AXH32571.1 di-trans,poly-cis-decaprenylcistransferase [Francisella opportunistica]